MCGICGIFFSNRDWHVKGDVLAGMNRRIVHRGPDDEGFFVEENVGLAMRRLSIIDVKSGHQPLANENQDVWIVFNGEIYNHAELRAGLEARGHRYRTRSDTETIVHLYEEYGRDCVKHLRGMFAFVIWDRRKRVDFRGARPPRDQALLLSLGRQGVSLRLGDQNDSRVSRRGGGIQSRHAGGVSHVRLHHRAGDDVCRHPQAHARTHSGAFRARRAEDRALLGSHGGSGCRAASARVLREEPTGNCSKVRSSRI